MLYNDSRLAWRGSAPWRRHFSARADRSRPPGLNTRHTWPRCRRWMPFRNGHTTRPGGNGSSTAPQLYIEKQRFVVTHPFHPLHGREFELIEMTSMAGVSLVHYLNDEGTLRTIRQAFTSAAEVDPFARVAAGRSAFRVSDLLELSALLDSLSGDGRAPGEGPDDGESVKEIMPNV